MWNCMVAESDYHHEIRGNIFRVFPLMRSTSYPLPYLKQRSCCAPSNVAGIVFELRICLKPLRVVARVLSTHSIPTHFLKCGHTDLPISNVVHSICRLITTGRCQKCMPISESAIPKYDLDHAASTQKSWPPRDRTSSRNNKPTNSKLKEESPASADPRYGTCHMWRAA